MSAKQIRESEALEDYLQRELKPRTKNIVKYLTHRESRFFNSIILGVFDGLPDWFEFDLSALPERIPHATMGSIGESLGILSFSGNEKIFAIDGQHRARAIANASEEHHEAIATDEYSVIFVAHRDDAPGKKRTRRLFCDINKNAVPVSAGDKVIIDEDDICAIVTRRVFADYVPFRGGAQIALSERKEVLVTKDADGRDIDHYTSLLALFTVCRKLKVLHRKAAETKPLDDANILNLKGIVCEFFDSLIANEPGTKSYFEGAATLGELRERNVNPFFKPVGLEIAARTYVFAVRANAKPQFERALREVNFNNPGGVFEGIIWAGGLIKADGKSKTAAVNVFLYVLNLFPQADEASLLESIRELTRNTAYTLPEKLT